MNPGPLVQSTAPPGNPAGAGSVLCPRPTGRAQPHIANHEREVSGMRRPGLRVPLFDLIGSSITAGIMIHVLLFAPGVDTTGDKIVCGLAAAVLIAVAVVSGIDVRKHYRNRREGRA